VAAGVVSGVPPIDDTTEPGLGGKATGAGLPGAKGGAKGRGGGNGAGIVGVAIGLGGVIGVGATTGAGAGLGGTTGLGDWSGAGGLTTGGAIGAVFEDTRAGGEKGLGNDGRGLGAGAAADLGGKGLID